MCEEQYKPIDEEMLYGVPVEEQPKTDPDRNFFDEHQAIVNDKATNENTDCTDYKT